MLFCEANSHFFKIYLLTFKRKVTPQTRFVDICEDQGQEKREVGEENQGRKVLEILVFLSHFNSEIEADQNRKKKKW